jgi:pimeloyl-ACP methyl ester carboxylesterase
MAECTESTFDYKGSNVFMRRGGSGEPLLFLHGAGGVAAWMPFLDQLSDSFDVIVPDHPTYGRSDEPDWVEDVADVAYFYMDFLENNGLENVHVVGQSMGGWIALEMAIRNTSRIKTLTLVGSAGIRIKGQPAADIFILNDEELTRTLLVDEGRIQALLAMELSEDQQDTLIKNKVATARLGWQPRLFNPRLRKWMHRIDVPTHIIWGTEDKVIPPSYAAEFQSLISGSKVTMIDKCGHLPNIERTEAFVEAVGGFLNG